MYAIVLDLHVVHPELFIRPPEPFSDRRWRRLFLIPKTNNARYAVRCEEFVKCPDYDTFAQLKFGYDGITAGIGRDALRVGDRIIVAVGPKHKVPACLVYEIGK